MTDEVEATSNATVFGDSAAQSTVLENLVGSAPNYQSWLVSMAVPYLGDDPIELGSGLGDYAGSWLAQGQPRITVTEADESRLGMLTARFRDDPRVTVRRINLDEPGTGGYSSLVSYNVLEHIPDDVAALAAARCLVRPGGYVFSFVPAFPVAMSDFDRRIGHFRRYRIATIGRAMTSAGLQPVSLRYVNAPGLLAWIVGMRLLRMNPADSALMKVWDACVVPAVRAIEQRVRMPFGQSIVAVGRVV